jgi:Family of unknown function (DUF6247)
MLPVIRQRAPGAGHDFGGVQGCGGASGCPYGLGWVTRRPGARSGRQCRPGHASWPGCEQECVLSWAGASMTVMTHPLVEGQPVVPLPAREPAALRAAVARLDLAALARFEADWTAATARARDEYSLLPARYFVEHWFTWVCVERWPALAARLRACERIVAESADRSERRAAAAEISQILRQAETATA